MQTIFYVVSISLTAMVAGLIIAVEHYFPWRMLIGKNPPRLVCYTLGMLAILGPYTLLIAVWAVTINAPLYLAAIALWVVVVSSGLSTAACYALDTFLLNRTKVVESLKRESELRAQIEKMGAAYVSAND